MAPRCALAVLAGGCTKDGDGAASADPPDPAAPAESSSSDVATPDSLPAVVQELEIDGTEYAFEINPDPAGRVGARGGP